MYFFPACNNGSNSVIVKDSDSAKMKIRKYDTIANKLNTGKMKSDDSIEIAINNMNTSIKSMKLNGNTDIDFANIMIEYHRGAVDMSLQEVKSGTDAGMKGLAKEIIRNQMDEQSKIGTIARDIKYLKINGGNNDELPQKISGLKSKIDSINLTQNIDKDYVNLMIKHHEIEIEIAKYEFSQGTNIQLRQMAQQIVATQTKEMSLFKKWLFISK